MASRIVRLLPAIRSGTLCKSSNLFKCAPNYAPIVVNAPRNFFNNTIVRPFSTEVNRAEIEERVMNVCKAYDRINKDKLNVDSHFTNDLGLDSLDHVEVIMEIENEFGLEIPDVEAEKLMTPAQIIEMLYQKKVRKSKLVI